MYHSLLEDALEDVRFETTTYPGQEGELADRAATEGYDVVVAVGGDGTWSNVADRLISSGRQDIALGILPNGTGNDFGRNLGYDPRNPAHAVRVLAEGHTRPSDVGHLYSLSASEHHPDVEETRYFLNLIGFGFDVAVIDAAKKARFLKGELLYKMTALQQILRFPGFQFTMRSAGGEERTGEHLMLTLSNGTYFGGGFPIAPGASVTDGRLHACRILDSPSFSRLKLFNMAERGRHVGSDQVEIIDDLSFQLTFDAPPRFEMDGEVRRSVTPTVNVRILPGALRVISPTVTAAERKTS